MKTITTFFSIAFLCGLFFENIIKSDKTDKVERKINDKPSKFWMCRSRGTERPLRDEY